jgi:hypothetical protein
MCSGLSRRVSSSCSDRTRSPGQKRKPHRSRQQIRASAAYGDFRAGTLSKRLLDTLSTLYFYCVTLHDRMLLGEASRPVDVRVLVSRRLNGWHWPVAWQVTGLHLVGGIRPWCDPITLTFAAW